MKATLEFDLNDPDERREHSMAVNGRKAYMVLSDISGEFRKILKYGQGIEAGTKMALPNGYYEVTEQDEKMLRHAFEVARGILLEAVENRDVNLDDLY